MVKILDYRAVSAGQRPAGGDGISTDSARAVRGWRWFPGRPRTLPSAVRTRPGRHCGPPLVGYSAQVTSEVHLRVDLSVLGPEKGSAAAAARPGSPPEPATCGPGCRHGPRPGPARCRATRRHHRAGQAMTRPGPGEPTYTAVMIEPSGCRPEGRPVKLSRPPSRSRDSSSSIPVTPLMRARTASRVATARVLRPSPRINWRTGASRSAGNWSTRWWNSSRMALIPRVHDDRG